MKFKKYIPNSREGFLYEYSDVLFDSIDFGHYWQGRFGDNFICYLTIIHYYLTFMHIAPLTK